ncbi:GEVED domain-containing protein [Flavobacterium cerinum]|uniref:GEVED domain-containing protein n=1 Tax=Flavobacterium cerinum TaxID=2502784 RepID=A0ABY5IT87_9FLAO|nr:GEVED domain-containing protein [Flavobacterium cerinum]UUC46014.1 GEVED domain-containing protein [Flavobacterium cerinum]
MKNNYIFLLLFLSSMAMGQNTVQPQWNTQGITVAGGNGAGSDANQLMMPYSVFVDEQNNIYVADAPNHRIQKWLPGATTGITVAGGNGAGDGSNQLNYPTGVWVKNDGTIYILDSFNARIQQWLPAAITGTTVAGDNGVGSAENQMSYPGGFFLKGNDFYIADSGNSRILKWGIGNTTGSVVAGGSFGAGMNQLGNPNLSGTVYVDNDNAIYVTDFSNNRIQKWHSGATDAITVAGGNGDGSGNNQTFTPNGIYVLNGGIILIAEYGNNRISQWTESQSEGTVIAGGNGSGLAANQLNLPRGLFVAQNGDLYVTDFGNNRIQKFEAIPQQQPICTENLGGGLEPSFVELKINGTNFLHTTYEEPTIYYHEYPQSGNTTTPLNRGQQYSFYTFTSSEAVIGLWIDYNRNNIFEANEYTQLVNNMNSQNTKNFTVSTNALIGTTKMRLRSRAYGSTIEDNDACTHFGSGETRDYTITIADSNLSLGENETAKKVHLFPNPTQSTLNIQASKPVSIAILSLDGRIQIPREQTNVLNLQSLSPGIYMALVYDEDLTIREVVKIIKQ